DHGAAADATPKPAQQVGGGLIEAWGPGAGNARLRPAREGLPPLRHLPMGRVPQLVSHDPQFRGHSRHDVVRRPGALRPGAPTMHLLGAVPVDESAVVLPVEDLADGGGGPALPAGAGRYHVLLIQTLGHPGQAPACGAEFEETVDDGSLRRIGLACDVLPLWAAVGPWGGDL